MALLLIKLVYNFGVQMVMSLQWILMKLQRFNKFGR